MVSSIKVSSSWLVIKGAGRTNLVGKVKQETVRERKVGALQSGRPCLPKCLSFELWNLSLLPSCPLSLKDSVPLSLLSG